MICRHEWAFIIPKPAWDRDASKIEGSELGSHPSERQEHPHETLYPPFSSYSQKVLIALYENATPFEYRNLEEPAASAELPPSGPSSASRCLLDDGRCILGDSTIVAHLQAHHPGPVSLIRPAMRVWRLHMLDRVFDNYVMTPMQKWCWMRCARSRIATAMA